MKPTHLAVAICLLATTFIIYAEESAPVTNTDADPHTYSHAVEDDGDHTFWGWTPSATATLTNDYIWRGVSQTSNGPAIQGSFDISHDLGFYIGAWASNVEFDDFSSNSVELDLYAGFSRETDFGGLLPFSFTYDIGWLSYIYPEDSEPLNFNEVYFGLGVSPFENFNLSTYWYEDVGVVNKFGHGYLDLSADYTLPSWAWDIQIFGHGGRYFKGDRGTSYWDWKAGIARQIAGFNVELAYTDTDGADAGGGLDDAHFVASISRSIGDPQRSDVMPDGFHASASAAFTSDYIWRGVSQTSNGVAIQGSVDVSHDLGFYVGMWGSNVEFDDASANSLELDVYGGFSRETDFAGVLPFSFMYDVGWLSYIYPNDSDALNFNEIYFGLGVSPVEKLNFSTYWYEDIGVVNKFGHGYLDMSVDYTLPSWAWDITMLAHGGRYFKGNRGVSYWDWKAGLAKDIGPFNIEVVYSDTDGASADGDRTLDDARGVATISTTF